MKSPPRGEVWLVDLGLAAKVRPCLILSVSLQDSDRSIVTMVPHTTSTRGSRFEVAASVRFLKPGAFDAQGLVTVSTTWLIRRVGTLTPTQLKSVEAAVLLWLGLHAD